MSNMILSFVKRTGVVSLAALAVACTFIAKADLKAGIGQPCATSDDCHGASVCDNGTCTTACALDTDCRATTLCFDGVCRGGLCKDNSHCGVGQSCVDNKCAGTVKVAVLLPGKGDGSDPWSTSHRLGLDEATNALSAKIRYGNELYSKKEGLSKAAEFATELEKYYADGARIFITASDVGTEEAIKAAGKHKDANYMAMGSRKNGGATNVGAFNAKGEQAWYAAGRIAGRVANKGSKCVGAILPRPTKQLVRETNAFVRGVRRQEPTARIVVRWLGGPRDTVVDPTYDYTGNANAGGPGFITYNSRGGDRKLFREELLAAQIADLGCSVIMHRTESQRVVTFVENTLKDMVKSKGITLFSMGVDIRDSCRITPSQTDSAWLESCLGSLYWNWGGLYQKNFDLMLKNTWQGGLVYEDFRVGEGALRKFALSPFPTFTGIEEGAADAYLVEAADDGPEGVFAGSPPPHHSGELQTRFTGQRDLDKNGVADPTQAVAPGLSIEQEELDRMCWFVEGTQELKQHSPDSAVILTNLIPAMVPYGPPVSGQVVTMDEAITADKTKYGDVITFARTVTGEDPPTYMSCPLN